MESVGKCQSIIDACINFKNSVAMFDEKEKLSKKILSVLGEFYVLRELLAYGFPYVTYKGGQSSDDLLIENPRIRIEVKTSTLKKDTRIFQGKIDVWGWTAETRNQMEKRMKNKHDTRFDYLVAVALDKTWEQPNFYVFSYDETVTNSTLEYPLEKSPIYPSIFKRIQAFQTQEDFDYALKIEPENKRDFITPVDRALVGRKNDFERNWGKIKP